jgi:hypothetical protein
VIVELYVKKLSPGCLSISRQTPVNRILRNTVQLDAGQTSRGFRRLMRAAYAGLLWRRRDRRRMIVGFEVTKSKRVEEVE